MGTAQARYEATRKHPRYNCDLGVEVRVGDAKTGYWGTLADICLGGCYVNTFSPLPAGTPVVLLVRTPSADVSITGKTVTFHPGVGMGIEFSGFVSAADEANLKTLVTELSQKS